MRIDLSIHLEVKDWGRVVKVEPVLFNAYWGKLKRISPPPASWRRDEHQNHWVIYRHPQLPTVSIDYSVEVQPLGTFPDSIFSPPHVLLNQKKTFIGVEFENFSYILHFVKTECPDPAEWQDCLRAGYFTTISRHPNPCEVFAKLVAQIASHFGYPIAYFHGVVEGSQEGHAWVVVNVHGRKIVVDPAYPYRGERRFVRVINSRTHEMMVYRKKVSSSHSSPLSFKTTVIWK